MDSRGVGRRRGATVAASVLLAAVLTACTSTSGSGATSSGVARPDSPAAGPTATVAPLTGGHGINLVSGASLPTLPAGWTQSEYSLSGTATAYRAVGALPADGRFQLAPTTKAPYETRIVVRRPPKATFSGTVVVEWLNVSGGLDSAPDYTYLADELLREGDAWVGVSAQFIGVDGGPVAVSTPVSALGGAGKGLVNLDPARYGGLHHPGDAYAYDIFTQAGRTLRHPGAVDPLGGLRPTELLAAGESQSAMMLTTYVDGVQPLEREYDGFLLHSRGGAAPPLGSPGSGIDITQAVVGPPVRIRTDTDVPVLMTESESDVAGILNYLPAAQPDTRRVRLWEMAGTSHVDRYQLGAAAGLFGCAVPVNDGPERFLVRSAFAHLERWARTGTPPAPAPRFDVADGAYVRSNDGIILGGIRTPPVDVPVDVLSGSPWPGSSLACILAGSTTPLPAARLAQLYPTPADYLRAYGTDLGNAIRAGWVLPADRAELLAMAQPGRIPG